MSPGKIAAIVGGIAALAGLIYVLSAQPVELSPPKDSPTPALLPTPAPVAAAPNPKPASVDAGDPVAELTHARISAAIDDGQRPSQLANTPRARSNSPPSVAIVACEEELLALRELPRDTEGYRVASAGLKRLYVRLQEIATSAAPEWRLAATVLMGECMTELAELSETLTPTLCANERLDHDHCAELMAQMGQNTSRATAVEHYRAAVQQATDDRLDTPYAELAKARLKR